MRTPPVPIDPKLNLTELYWALETLIDRAVTKEKETCDEDNNKSPLANRFWAGEATGLRMAQNMLGGDIASNLASFDALDAFNELKESKSEIRHD